MTLLVKIIRRHPADLLLAAEAFVLLGFFRVCLALLPVRRILRMVTHGEAGLKSGSDAAQIAAESASARHASCLARRVRWAVSAISRNSVMEFVCFPQALAGYTMLRWRRVPSTMVYGVARSPEGSLIAHTWLTVGERIVVGGEASGDFTPVERWT
ncbi:MAG TPA: lasso peptide biosynthesis B2 protein [Acidobacteriaceae bacterium]